MNATAAAPAGTRSAAERHVGVIFSGLMLVLLLAALDSTIVATAELSGELKAAAEPAAS